MVQFERYDMIAGYTVCNIQESTLQGKQSKFKQEIARNSKKYIQTDEKRAFAEQRTRTSRVGAGRVRSCRTHWNAFSRNTLSDIALHQRRQSNPRMNPTIRAKTEALRAGDEVDGTLETIRERDCLVSQLKRELGVVTRREGDGTLTCIECVLEVAEYAKVAKAVGK